MTDVHLPPEKDPGVTQLPAVLAALDRSVKPFTRGKLTDEQKDMVERIVFVNVDPTYRDFGTDAEKAGMLGLALHEYHVLNNTDYARKLYVQASRNIAAKNLPQAAARVAEIASQQDHTKQGESLNAARVLLDMAQEKEKGGGVVQVNMNFESLLTQANQPKVIDAEERKDANG